MVQTKLVFHQTIVFRLAFVGCSSSSETHGLGFAGHRLQLSCRRLANTAT